MVHVLGSTNKQHVISQVRWHHPCEGYIKVNLDGSYLGNFGNTGFGDILKNYRGIWIHGF
jgi:hypothetical protein